MPEDSVSQLVRVQGAPTNKIEYKLLYIKECGDLKTGHSNTGNIRKLEVFKFRFSNGSISLDRFIYIKVLAYEYAAILSLDYSKTRPFEIQIKVDHSKTRHLPFSDPNCNPTFNLRIVFSGKHLKNECECMLSLKEWLGTTVLIYPSL